MVLQNFSGSNTDGLFTTAVFKLFLESFFGKKSGSCRFGIIRVIFFLY